MKKIILILSGVLLTQNACDLQPRVMSFPDTVGEFISARYPALLADPYASPEIYNSAASDYGVYASPNLYGTESGDDYVIYASVNDYIVPTIKAVAKYENVYLLGTPFSRPLIAKKLVEIAKKENADAICHGCTGKGNDQVRFELGIKAFAPDMPVIVPWRTWELKSREDEIEYAEKHNIPLKINRETNYSKDKNIWHLSHEGLDLENPANEPQYDKILEMGVTPQKAPDKETIITLGFEKGVPVSIDGKKLSVLDIILQLNEIGGKNGIGIIDMVENRLVGMKSRGVYETPGGTIIYQAHEWLETLCLDKETFHYKQQIANKFGELLYDAQWFSPLREALSAFVDKTQENVTGEVKLKLYKGNIIKSSMKSSYSMIVSKAGSGFYAYAPSIMIKNGTTYIWSCQNKTANKTHDHIYLNTYYLELYTGETKKLEVFFSVLTLYYREFFCGKLYRRQKYV